MRHCVPSKTPARRCASRNLLTTKPFLYVFNADEAVLNDPARSELRALVRPPMSVFLDAAIESERPNWTTSRPRSAGRASAG